MSIISWLFGGYKDRGDELDAAIARIEKISREFRNSDIEELKFDLGEVTSNGLRVLKESDGEEL